MVYYVSQTNLIKLSVIRELFMKTKNKVRKVLLIIPIALLCVILVLWISAYIGFKCGSVTNAQAFQRRFDAAVAPKNIHEAILLVENTTGDFSVSYGYGGRNTDSPIVIASVTKMFTATCVIKLAEEGRLSLDDKICQYMDDDILSGLHVYKGAEYSYCLTVSDLLFQTSGLPDYFWNSELVRSAIFDRDAYISFDQLIEETKKLPPRFAPNTGRAYYADINYDILGVILEKVTGLPLNELYQQYIFEPLGMDNTYLPVNDNDPVPHVYNGMDKLERPLFIASCRASGGCVSTARDLIVFSKVFWSGKLFDSKTFELLAVYRNLQPDMGPVSYGGGYMRIPLGGMNTFFLASGELVGHSGSTGSFVFYYPEKDLHFAGDLAQFENPSAVIRFVIQLAMSAK